MTLSDTCKQAFQKEEIQWDMMVPGYQLYRNQSSLHWQEGGKLYVHKTMWSIMEKVVKEKRSVIEYLWVEFPGGNKIILIQLLSA